LRRKPIGTGGDRGDSASGPLAAGGQQPSHPEREPAAHPSNTADQPNHRTHDDVNQIGKLKEIKERNEDREHEPLMSTIPSSSTSTSNPSLREAAAQGADSGGSQAVQYCPSGRLEEVPMNEGDGREPQPPRDLNLGLLLLLGGLFFLFVLLAGIFGLTP